MTDLTNGHWQRLQRAKNRSRLIYSTVTVLPRVQYCLKARTFAAFRRHSQR
ncbi:hypothetical protein ALO95_101780 [Pseudomonas syringae pv. antirrhini]|uniref:Uncharacterized protein n=2 Tax=Pseudomonas syringae group genomosp. 3 TaxID=251701 RepID=A0A3M5RD56_9PSED|nr:Unknown protein sequence [Pseudomonas syringae pv. maculicola]KPC06931.1 Unknown protein sequence [Pseudomonas syringae pv. maculicola str. M6]KPC07079.1 Unknown protein sequence [Pseudomonas amygdali pv. lachrymans]KPW30841.1 hypothetical protein ALO87_101930 [Pseudomonas syringae pv. apii]KPW59604.1 hypothetical protein ALO86_101671 [Pseudomonas syringae pv. berberidis]KPY28770.1 hypothetical protein ALO54_101872 [Pseudomonas syringae pv. philadelphi]RMM05335.1 hypothetical protein ALQ85